MFYDPSFSGIIDRDFAVATTTTRGATAFGIWPFNRYRRVELSGGVVHYSEQFEDPGLQDYSQGYQQQQFGRQLLNNGTMVPFGLAFIQETTVFREFGPLAGNTVRLSYEDRPQDRQHAHRARPPTSTRANTSASAGRACWRCAPRASRAGATIPATTSSAATQRCAAMTTSRLSGRTPAM